MGTGISPQVMGGIGTGLKVAGALSSGGAAASAGKAQQASAEYSAKQLEVNAGQSVAASQQAAIEEARKSMMLQSRALAVAGASGAGALDPTVLRIIGGIAAEGELASETQLYQGSERARAQLEQARATRFEGAQFAQAGEIKRRNAYLDAAGTIVGSASKSWNASSYKSTKPGTSPISEAKWTFK